MPYLLSYPAAYCVVSKDLVFATYSAKSVAFDAQATSELSLYFRGKYEPNTVGASTFAKLNSFKNDRNSTCYTNTLCYVCGGGGGMYSAEIQCTVYLDLVVVGHLLDPAGPGEDWSTGHAPGPFPPCAAQLVQYTAGRYGYVQQFRLL